MPFFIARSMLILAVLAMPSVVRAADGRVELELASDSGNSGLNLQPWYRIFADLKVGGLQIRQRRPGDAVGVVTAGTAANPVYRVTGILNERNELLLPGGKFTLRDQGRLSAWLKKLQTEGPGNSANSPFGLDEATLKRVHEQLRPPVEFSTKGMTRSDAIAGIKRLLALPVVQEVGNDRALAANGLIEEELKGVSVGTALAAILRPAGLALAPRKGPGGLEYFLHKPKPNVEVWPVGFAANDRDRELLPVLYETIEVTVDPVPLSEALEAIGSRLGAPLLFDHNALAYHRIDPTRAMVSLPATKIAYAVILRKLLGQTRLVYEVRTDERGKPFLWITTFQKVE